MPYYKQIFLTEEQEKNIVADYYNPDMKCKEIAQKYGFSKAYLNNLLTRLNVDKTFKQRIPPRKYKFNRQIFDVIDTEEKAYFVGLLMADGTITENKYMKLGLVDLEMIERFKAFLNYEGKIYRIKQKNPNCQPFWGLAIGCKQLIVRLKQLGLCERKADRTEIPKEIPRHLIHHFIRGYFDGDGNWALIGYKNGLRITSCSIKVLNQIQQFLIEETILRNRNYIFQDKRSKGNFPTYFIDIGRQDETEAFGTLMYENSTIYLERKRITFFDGMRKMYAKINEINNRKGSAYNGVRVFNGGFTACIINKRKIVIRKWFATEIEAALAYNEAAIKHNLPRKLNVINYDKPKPKLWDIIPLDDPSPTQKPI